MSEQNLSKITEVAVVPQVQGMHCELKGEGTVKCTVTISDVSLSVYSEVPLFVYTEQAVKNRLKQTVSRFMQEKPLDLTRLEQDFCDLLIATSKVQRVEMSLRSGDKLVTYALGQAVPDDKDGYLHLTPKREEWWQHPKVEPIVQSITEQLPDFEPWLLQKDQYIAILSQRSSLL